MYISRAKDFEKVGGHGTLEPLFGGHGTQGGGGTIIKGPRVQKAYKKLRGARGPLKNNKNH